MHEPRPSEYSAPRRFVRQWHRTIIPCLFAVAVFGLFADRIPGGVWIAVPGLCLILAACALLHGGIVVSREGIEWYILRPQWRYRKVPWGAVREVRKGLLGLQPIRLTVAHGRYEPWVWGTPRPDRNVDIEIWSNGYRGGDAIWDAVHKFRPSHDRVAVG